MWMVWGRNERRLNRGVAEARMAKKQCIEAEHQFEE